ncbi:Clavaminate synthase-like protein [Mytilinidion resinicola]|uniref:Clavaminate synthase-like protein n=1 Tax=Mytilinidion resinicola TaxID=574789 RepID=A0A6A6YYZ9_9PEZI|nr:Clavaminate synthase-like protein [Mytilinidion resinicola]KAF2813155.1 Clavaminate synthase-like protein [Mytilinidion resinicola]
MSFQHIPILPLSAARDEATKSRFLADLRDALLNVGFLYLSETGLPDGLVADVVRECRDFFETLPVEEKEAIEMKNEKSFLGWSRVDNETTAHNPDHREQLDLSTPQPIPSPTAPLYHNLLAPNQWPSHTHLPGFRPVFEDYMRRMASISTFFTSLIAEAIGLPATSFDRFFDADQQHKLKIVKYPEVAIPPLGPAATAEEKRGEDIARQGVGPHKDSMLTSYLLQASPQAGLQAQNARGEWVDCPPIDGTLVVAIGQGMEALTDGVCASTTHRVLSPREGEGPRYSVPFFQGVSYDAQFEAMDVPEAVLRLRDEARKGRKDDVEFTFVKGRWGHLGEATLMNRIKSHPDVGERWYPEQLAQIRAQQAREAQAKSKAA